MSIREGAMAQTTRVVDDLGNKGRVYTKGTRFKVEEFMTAGNAAEDEIDVDFYYGSFNGGINNIIVPADAVEEVLSPEKMAARKPPTQTEIRDQITSLLHGETKSFEVRESIASGEVAIELYGTTHDGLTFGFTVKVTGVWETDE